jgi:hypothetical protein
MVSTSRHPWPRASAAVVVTPPVAPRVEVGLIKLPIEMSPLFRYTPRPLRRAAMRDVGELSRFVGEHLTAAAVMVEIDEPLPASMRALQARRHLDSMDFDLALVDDERLRLVSRARLRRLRREQLGQPLLEVAESPRRDRMIVQTLPIREAARKLLRDSEPLLVVGDAGVTHIVTLADFAGVAGTAVALSFLLAVDGGLNELLLRRREHALAALTPEQREKAEELRSKAEAEGAALDLIDYLTMGARLSVLRKLQLHQQLDLGRREDHELLRTVRNEAAHRTLSDPARALEAINKAEWMLERLTTALAPAKRPLRGQLRLKTLPSVVSTCARFKAG